MISHSVYVNLSDGKVRVCVGPFQHKDHSSIWQREISANPEGLGHIMLFQFQTLLTTRTFKARVSCFANHSQHLSTDWEKSVISALWTQRVITCWRWRISSQCIYILMFYLLYGAFASQGHSNPMSLLFDKKYK